METYLDWVKDNVTNQEALKNFMLAWTFYERSNANYQVPDLVRVTGLLKSVGFHITKVERMEGESWTPGIVNGCTVEIQCPVSKTKITLSGPEAKCHCQRNLDSSWTLSWAGATVGLANINHSEMKIVMPPELTPGKAMIARICLSSLMSIIWPKEEDKSFSPYSMCDRLVKSLECVREKGSDVGSEPPVSLQCISPEGKDSMLTCYNRSLPDISHGPTRDGSYTNTPTSLNSRSSETVSETRNKNPARLSLPNSKFQPKQPPPNSPYWESSTARAKRYADMVKKRDAEKKQPK